METDNLDVSDDFESKASEIRKLVVEESVFQGENTIRKLFNLEIELQALQLLTSN